MENSMSRILAGSVVKRILKDIRVSPERSVRNLVDMALMFLDGSFQQDFFSTAQAMLQNESSAYYKLVRDLVSYVDIEHLYSFGMNLGYNGCTAGVHRIRENEKKLCCQIPWSLSIRLDTDQFSQKEDRYQSVIEDGEELGIYVWMLFCMKQPKEALSLVKTHGDSAFFLFCKPEYMTADFLEAAALLPNLMLVVQYDEKTNRVCTKLRKRGLLYSVWYEYRQKDTEMIINGNLFFGTQQSSPVFTVLLPAPECPDVVQQLSHQTVRRVRKEQNYHTIPWEMQGDNGVVDTLISGDVCCVYFDGNGYLWDWSRRAKNTQCNLFQHSLEDILVNAYPKKSS